jgi:peptidyl-tRNA hydrolase
VGRPKAVLSAGSEQEVVEIYRQALAIELPGYLVKNRGKTMVLPGTIVCFGIGRAIKE